MIRKETKGNVNLFKNTTVQKVCEFGYKDQINPTTFPLFGDNNIPDRIDPFITLFLNKKFELKYKFEKEETTQTPNFLLDVYNNTKTEKIAKIDNSVSAVTYYASSGLLISRGSTALVTKGGATREDHGKPQCGAYTYFTNSNIIGTQGGMEYTPNTQRFGKYRFALNNTYGNPLPCIDNQLQTLTAVATVISTELTKEENKIVYDLTNCYSVDGLIYLHREISHNSKTGKVQIKDYFESKRPVTFETAIIIKGAAFIQQGNLETKEAQIILDKTATLQHRYIEDKLLREPIPGKINRYALVLPNPTEKGEISYTIQPIPTTTP
jgi:hypothetical protein